MRQEIGTDGRLKLRGVIGLSWSLSFEIFAMAVSRAAT
jgi:hypothetical protein